MFKFVLMLVARSIIKNIHDFKNRYNVYRELNIFLKQGSKRAGIIAENNLKEIYEIMGLKKFT